MDFSIVQPSSSSSQKHSNAHVVRENESYERVESTVSTTVRSSPVFFLSRIEGVHFREEHRIHLRDWATFSWVLKILVSEIPSGLRSRSYWTRTASAFVQKGHYSFPLEIERMEAFDHQQSLLISFKRTFFDTPTYGPVYLHIQFEGKFY